MQQELIIEETLEGNCFCVYKRISTTGRSLYVAEGCLENGEVVVLDHWNLSTLQRKLRELIPVIRLSRELRPSEKVAAWREAKFDEADLSI